MKTIFRILAAALLLSATQVAHAAPTQQVTTASALTYAQGQADGADEEAYYAAVYGRGTQEYQDAIDAATALAAYNARNSEEPFYWRGYVNGLQY